MDASIVIIFLSKTFYDFVDDSSIMGKNSHSHVLSRC